MNKYLKWILVSIGTLIFLSVLIIYLFMYLFLNENAFTKNSIRYYFLSDDMKSKFIIYPYGEPKYWRGDLDTRVEYMNVYYCTKIDKNSLKEIFYKMGYTHKDNNMLFNENRTTEIDIGQCEANNSLASIRISEKEQ